MLTCDVSTYFRLLHGRGLLQYCGADKVCGACSEILTAPLTGIVNSSSMGRIINYRIIDWGHVIKVCHLIRFLTIENMFLPLPYCNCSHISKIKK